MQILLSTKQDIDTIFDLYDKAVNYQKERYRLHWPVFERSLVETEIEEQRQFKIVVNNTIVCVFAIAYDDPLIWEERNKDAAVYIHRIATNPNYRGQNFVTKIVEWVKNHAIKNRKNYIRLDTTGENKKLIAHYCKSGFSYLGMIYLKNTNGLPKHYQNGEPVCLFEIKL